MTREEAIKTLRELWRETNDTWYEEVYNMAIEALSTDTTQGEWIKHEGKWVDFDFYPTKCECSQCHYYVDEGYDSIFCPNCGARMKGGVE